MELRALLFTSDGSSTATLCHVLTELGIQAEICSERVTAIPRIASENYDAIIVDWDLEEDAKLLLKSARTQKAQGLNLALVPDDAAVARALQHGANSVIKKPLDANEARETLSTARDLILSRHTEQREKNTRLAALPVESKSADSPAHETTSDPKPGFMPQSMMRSALEAEEKVARPENSGGLGWQAARGPASLEKQDAELREVQPVSRKRWDEVKTIFRESPKEPQAEVPEVQKTQGSQDGTGVFSSLPEETEAPLAEESSSTPRYLVFAMVACCLIAAALYVWAPGDSYRGRLNAIFHLLSVKSKQPSDAPPAAALPVPREKPADPAPAKAMEEMVQDAAPVDSTDVDPSKIQIIETKVIPKPGAQQPPTTEIPADSDQAKGPAPADSKTETVTVIETPHAAPVPTTPPAPTPPPPPVTRTPENSLPASEGRVGVIIPDSLRNMPAPPTGSSVEAFSVPEETAQSLVIHKVDPQYPAQAVSQRLEGVVVLQAWVAKDGTVRDLKLLKGYFALGRAAIDAVRQWRFKPYTQNGQAVDFQTSITLSFHHPN